MIDKNSWFWLLKPWVVIVYISLLPIWLHLSGILSALDIPFVCIILSCILVFLLQMLAVCILNDGGDATNIDIIYALLRFKRNYTKYKYKVFCVKMKSDNVLYIPAVKAFYGDGYGYILQCRDYLDADVTNYITHSKRKALKNAYSSYAEAKNCIERMKEDQASVYKRETASSNAATVSKVIEVKIK